MSECNKSFYELVQIVAADKYNDITSLQGGLQFALSTAFSAVPVLAGAAGLVDDIAKEGSQFVWTLTSGSASLSVELR
jgi:hypothetical protein